MEEQLKQQVIGERYRINRKKGSHTKEVLAVLGSQSVCLSVKCLVRNEKLSSPRELSSANMFRLDEFIFGVWQDMSP